MSSADDLQTAVLGHIAEVQALRVALSKYDPKHPLLSNAALRQRIHAAGQRAAGEPNAEESARKAGAGARY